MIEHTSIPVSNLEKSKKFYVAALKPLGYELVQEFDEAAGFKEGGHTSFWIEKKDPIVSTHVAFLANNREAVDAFYEAGMTAGGSDNGKPGRREGYGYAAFVYDPDGNNIEAVLFEEGDE